MNLSVFRTLAVFSLIAILSTAAGCKRNPKGLTTLNGTKGREGQVGEVGPKPPETGIGTGTKIGSEPVPETKTTVLPPSQDLPPNVTGVPAANSPNLDDYNQNRDIFKADTVYFDLDRSTIKKGETLKIEDVGAYLKSDKNSKLLIEGHCDERGTEEYNRALGERRALALREYLVNSGINADRIFTLTFGEDHPADPGHNETAWSKNRRGEFILLKPKQ